jgi:hypothetical protein
MGKITENVSFSLVFGTGKNPSFSLKENFSFVGMEKLRKRDPFTCSFHMQKIDNFLLTKRLGKSNTFPSNFSS